MEYRETYGFSAPAEVVFNTLTDRQRVTRWLPRGLAAEPAGDGVRVRTSAGEREYRFATSAEELRLAWRPAEGAGWSGDATVSDAPGGGSRVDVRLESPGPADDDRVRQLLAEALQHLDRDVTDNFTAG
jgi:uncharacterized protein YndB with AHSA1/START domain